MKIKLVTASSAFVSNVEVSGFDFPKLVRWGDRVFEFKSLYDEQVYGSLAEVPVDSEAIYKEIDIPVVRWRG